MESEQQGNNETVTTRHSHSFPVVLGNFKVSSGFWGECECGERRWFRATTRKQTMREFRERGVEVQS